MTQANDQGVVTGRFTVPANVPAGTKSVVFVGETGSRAETTYTGSGTITSLQLRRVTNITTRRYDPLAQTFTLMEPRLLVGVDVWFTKKGVHDVRLQIRETDTGLPNQTILSETIKKTDEIAVDGSVTEFRFNPISAAAGVEYAIVILTDDPDYEVRIAEIGKFDGTRGWVTSQPYQVGVLLSSSNAVTWTPHQTMDLTFKLYAAKFTHTERVVDCGTVTAADVSDLMPMASVERTSSETDVRFVVTDPENEETYEILDDQVLNLDKRLTGELQVEARLTGSEKFSPVLLPGPQLALGNLQETATYVTRSISCGDDPCNLKICLEGLFSGTSGVDVYRETATADEWQQITEFSATSAGDNWSERTYSETDLDQNNVRVKLELRGDAANRPRVRNLRVITT